MKRMILILLVVISWMTTIPSHSMDDPRKPSREQNIKERAKQVLGTIFKRKEPVYLTDDQLDENYRQFIMKVFPHESDYTDTIVTDPEEQLKLEGYNFSKKFHFYPPGKYAAGTQGYWFFNIGSKFEKIHQKLGQEWKIHVTAFPHSAQKIAELILPHIQGLRGQEDAYVSYKIIKSLPILRMLTAFHQVEDYETQPGKFLVIYPDNLTHAYELAKKIDTILVKAKQKGILNDMDFLPLNGDALVGKSGGVYVRYAAISDTLREVTPEGKILSYEGISDDRAHPWPDFMNKGNPYWEDQPNPFKDLKLYWRSPNDEEITWENRPASWNDLINSQEHSSDDSSSDEEN